MPSPFWMLPSSFCCTVLCLCLLLHGAGAGSPSHPASDAGGALVSSHAGEAEAEAAAGVSMVGLDSSARTYPELAYVSFLYADSPEWLSGLTVLSKSLAGVGTTIGTLACVVTPDVSAATRRALLAGGYTDIVPLEPHELIYRASPAGARAASRGFHTAKVR